MRPRECVQRYRVSSWTAIPTMIQDFFANPDIAKYDLSSIRRLSGGGAAMPAAVAQRLLEYGRHLLRRLWTVGDHGGHAYQSRRQHAEEAVPGHSHLRRRLARGRSGHAARTCRRAKSARSSRTGRKSSWATGTNPRTPRRPWSRSTASASCAPAISAESTRTGYFFMVDRLKRMINASGFKVWPTEVESLMYQHPAVLEACVIGATGCAPRRDRQGRHRAAGRNGAARSRRRRSSTGAARTWRRTNARESSNSSMRLPKSGAGKIMWRELQDREAAAAQQRATLP